MPVTSAQIVAAARSYKGLPFRHQGRSRLTGIDCVGLPLCVGDELHLLDKNGLIIQANLYHEYATQPIGRYVYDVCDKHLIWKPLRLLAPGDVVALMVPTVPCHVGIIGNWPEGLTLIHAYNSGKEPKVIEHLLDKKWHRRIAGCFKYPEVEE